MASCLASTSRAVLGAQSRQAGLASSTGAAVASSSQQLKRAYRSEQQRTFAASAIARQDGQTQQQTRSNDPLMQPHDVTAPAQEAAEAAAVAARARAQISSSQSSSALPPSEQFDRERRKMHLRRATLDTMGELASTQTKKTAYRPYKGRLDPVTARDLTVSHLMAATAHLGHSKSTLQRASSAFAYGTRHGQVIIDVEKHTLPALKLAAKVVSKVVYNDGVVVFLGTRPHMEDFTLAAAKRLGKNGYHVTKDRWQGGTLTNASKLLSRAVLADMKTYEREYSETLEGRKRGAQIDSTKLASQTLMPDLMIVLNPKENLHAIREATQLGVPTIGIIDTDVDPRIVTYAIPCNDDALVAVELVAGVLSKAGQVAAQERARDQDEADKRARSHNGRK